MSGLPEIGRWIKYQYKNFDETEFVCKVKEYEDCESFGCAGVGAHHEVEQQAVLEYPGGGVGFRAKAFFQTMNWSYIPEPSEEELATAVIKSREVFAKWDTLRA